MSDLSIGVLALQGAFVEHQALLESLGVTTRQVRTVDQMAGLDGLVIPGGESTTIGLIGGDSGLVEAMRGDIRAGLPVFGTCAGMIMLSRATTDGPQPLIGTMDTEVRRNAFGRQIASFETDLRISGITGDPYPAVFIRAPWIASYGDDVAILASVSGHPVAARQANMLVTAFHPELTDDPRVHRLYVDMVRGADTGEPKQTVGGGIRVGAQ